MKKNNNVRLWLMVIAVSLTFILAGCVDEDDSSGDDSTTTTGSTNSGNTAASNTSSTAANPYTGDITTNTTWSGNVYFKGYVRIVSGVTLTVTEGTTVYANTEDLSTLVVEQGGKMMAIGTAEKPIVFTSANPVGSRARGDWGGIAVNGKSQYNKGAATNGSNEGVGEGQTGTYGGATDLADNSGTFKYVRIEFGGRKLATEDELNGFSLQAVGSGTIIENVHLHNNSDDGVEMFGGTVNLRKIISTANGDDQIDWTGGWSGSIQYAVVAPIDGDRGIEADNNSSDNNATPRSNVKISNFTAFVSQAQKDGQEGALFRVGTHAILKNAYIGGFDKCIEVDDESTINAIGTGIKIGSVVMEGCNKIDAKHSDDNGNVIVDKSSDLQGSLTIGGSITFLNASNVANLSALQSSTSPFKPAADLTTDVVDPSSDSDLGSSFFEKAEFIGAVSASDDWTAWTKYPAN